MRAITPFRSGDTVTFGGEITDKYREEDGQGLVECRVKRRSTSVATWSASPTR